MLSPDQWNSLKNIAAVLGGVAAVFAILGGLIKAWTTLLAPAYRDWRHRRTLEGALGAELYDVEEIRRATKLYEPPDCQSLDPAGEEDFRHNVPTREPLFEKMDELLDRPDRNKFLFVLADSGMGKTSFLLNYYARHWRSRSRRKRYDLRIAPLNLPRADEWIKRRHGPAAHA